MIQQAYKYVSLNLWPCLMFLKLEITNILKSSWWGLEKSELPWEQTCMVIGVFPVLAKQVSMVCVAKWPR